jgi:hypothetical protein
MSSFVEVRLATLRHTLRCRTKLTKIRRHMTRPSRTAIASSGLWMISRVCSRCWIRRVKVGDGRHGSGLNQASRLDLHRGTGSWEEEDADYGRGIHCAAGSMDPVSWRVDHRCLLRLHLPLPGLECDDSNLERSDPWALEFTLILTSTLGTAKAFSWYTLSPLDQPLSVSSE